MESIEGKLDELLEVLGATHSRAKNLRNEVGLGRLRKEFGQDFGPLAKGKSLLRTFAARLMHESREVAGFCSAIDFEEELTKLKGAQAQDGSAALLKLERLQQLQVSRKQQQQVNLLHKTLETAAADIVALEQQMLGKVDSAGATDAWSEEVQAQIAELEELAETYKQESLARGVQLQWLLSPSFLQEARSSTRAQNPSFNDLASHMAYGPKAKGPRPRK